MCIYIVYVYVYIYIYIYIPWRRKWQPTPLLLPGSFHPCNSPAVRILLFPFYK